LNGNRLAALRGLRLIIAIFSEMTVNCKTGRIHKTPETMIIVIEPAWEKLYLGYKIELYVQMASIQRCSGIDGGPDH
jgi:hypothetical protein